MLSLDAAKALLSESAVNSLKNIVEPAPSVNFNNKGNSDILMQALCNGIGDNIIKTSSLDSQTSKQLNSSTTSLSEHKLLRIIKTIRKKQPDIVCEVSLTSANMSQIIKKWTIDGSREMFPDIYEFVIEYFNITPMSVRNKLVDILKPTIVNNIAQFVTKYSIGEDVHISITTITRLVNMESRLLFAEFKKDTGT